MSGGGGGGGEESRGGEGITITLFMSLSFFPVTIFAQDALKIYTCIDNYEMMMFKHVPKTEKCCCASKDNCYICANRTVWFNKKN